MSKPWKKYIDAFKNIDKIAEGIVGRIEISCVGRYG